MQACTSSQSMQSTLSADRAASTFVPFTKAANAEAFLFDVLPVSGTAYVSGTSRDSVTSQCKAACADNPECEGYVLTKTSNGLGVTYATVQDNERRDHGREQPMGRTGHAANAASQAI